jgi:hypothetical protein
VPSKTAGAPSVAPAGPRDRQPGEFVERAVERRRREARRRVVVADRRQPGAAVHPHRLAPVHAVGRHLHHEVVVAGQADLGAPREAGLEDERRRVRLSRLARDQADVAAPAIVRFHGREERRLRSHREAVGVVGRGVHAEVREGTEEGADRRPVRTVAHEHRCVRGVEGDPPVARHEERPMPRRQARRRRPHARSTRRRRRRRRCSGRPPRPSRGARRGVASRTASCTSVSRRASASLWVTCFWAWAAARYGRARRDVSDMFPPRRETFAAGAAGAGWGRLRT